MICKLPFCLLVDRSCMPLMTICPIPQDNFDEWGPIERIYNVASKTIAFVQYYWRASAEFAKEAMQVSLRKRSPNAACYMRSQVSLLHIAWISS